MFLHPSELFTLWHSPMVLFSVCVQLYAQKSIRGILAIFFKKRKKCLLKHFFVVKNIYYVKLYYFMIFIARDSLKFTHV